MTPRRAAFEAGLARGALALGRIMPRPGLRALGSLLGSLGYLFGRRRRRDAMENLELAFGDRLSHREACRLVHAAWRHFGRITADALAFPGLTAESVESLVRYEGLEHLRAAYGRGKGVLLFSAHFGHWELMALMQGFLGYRLMVLTRPLDNPELEQMLGALRTVSGNLVVHKRQGVREMLGALRDGLGVAMLIDQDARRFGVFVPFFGRPASTTPALAILALRTGAPVLPFFSRPCADGRLEVHYGPEVPVVRTANRQEDIVRLTAQCTSIVEQWVRRHPEYWLWMHRRWKTRPPRPKPAEAR